MLTNVERQTRWRAKHKRYIAELEAEVKAKDAELARLRMKIEDMDEFRCLFKQLLRRIDELVTIT